jgi:hypothetical protein
MPQTDAPIDPRAAASSPVRAWVVLLGVVAVAGLSGVGALVSRAVRVERIEATAARAQLEEVRRQFRESPALVQRGEGGRLVRTDASGRSGAPPTILSVLAYHASSQRLIRADVPLWFLKLKGPAATLALRDTGFDLEALGLTASDLERSGPGLVLDDRSSDGSAILAFTR